jgi:hypothetical protein
MLMSPSWAKQKTGVSPVSIRLTVAGLNQRYEHLELTNQVNNGESPSRMILTAEKKDQANI